MFRISKNLYTLLFFVLPFTTNTFFSAFLNQPLEGEFHTLKVAPNTRLYAFNEDNLSRKNQDYTLNIGKTLDILDTDYQKIFKEVPNFDIYTEDIMLTDPSGIRLQGLPVYKNLFEMIHNIANLFIKDCFIDYRLIYRPETKKVKVNWKLEINFRLRKFPFYIQANSIYDIDKDAKIYNHIIDKLIINDKKIQPPYNIPTHYVNWISYKSDKKIVPSFYVKIKKRFYKIMQLCSNVLEQLKICETNEDCSYPLTCCNHSFLKTCCKEGGRLENSYYPHPYFKRPIRVKAHYDN